MKRTLLVLLLSPLFSNAQLLEITAGAGPVVHSFNVRNEPINPNVESNALIGYNASAAVTVKIPYNLRVGLSASVLGISYNHSFAGTVINESRISAKPILFEAQIISRNHFKKIDLDLGILAGICGNKTTKSRSIQNGSDKVIYHTNTWYAYGVIASLQYNLSKRFAFGADIQPKLISGMPVKRNVFVMPLLVKGTIKI